MALLRSALAQAVPPAALDTTILPSGRNCASIDAFSPWIVVGVFQPARSSTCSEPVNHEITSNCLPLTPTAKGYSMSEA